GCGAIGGTVAAGLVRDGHDVLVSDADPAVVAAINENGLRIEGPIENFAVAVPAVLPADLPERLDCPVLVACKSQHTAAAAASLAGRMHGDGFVVSMQNGMNADQLAAVVGAERVVEAFVNFGADVIAPGVVLRGSRETFVIGEVDGTISDRVRAVAADIADAKPTEDIMGYLWGKEAYGAMLAAIAVSDASIADGLEDPAYTPMLVAVAREVLDQAPVPPKGFDGFDPEDLEGSLAPLVVFNRRSAKTHSGIYRDLMVRHRPTEVPAHLGGLKGPMLRRVVELIGEIEQGRRTCERSNLDLLATYERLERLGRPLNAVASVIGAPRRAADGPLAGRPVGIKDIIAVEGVPTRCGSPASDPEPAAGDAELVRRLRTAGAEVFATTQCLEFAAGHANPEIGDTRNPHDPSRTSGGSSGGSAALVAAGVCDLTIGSDTGGSIRIPAAYCGVVGLKPTYGLLPVDGVFPLSRSCDHVGTLTATVAGARELLAVTADRADLIGLAQPEDLVGPVDVAHLADLASLADPADMADLDEPSGAGSPATYTIGVLAAQLADPSVTPEVRDAVSAALAQLQAAGWELRELTAPWLDELPAWEEVLSVIVAREASLVHSARDHSRYAEGTRALLSYGASIGEDRYAEASRRRDELTEAVEACLDGVDVLAGPTVGYQAPEEDPPFGVDDDSAEGRFTGPYNLTGHPAISIPVPISGLPAGLQLAGRRGQDLALLRVAAAAEALLAPATMPARSATRES
ncbi:MAG TPA: amidase family protein, partial [Streptosporangiaceae bacterium]|nr:amidase family protein [Streptosporangiaceae bacterium]